MTTETQQGQQIAVAEVWRGIDRLEGRMDSLESAVNRLSDRVDRLLYLILAIGGASIASIWISNLFGN